MKSIYKILVALAVVIAFLFFARLTHASLTPVSWIRDTVAGFIRPGILTDTLRIPSLTNCDTIDTDADGDFACGTDGGGGGGSIILDLTDNGSNESSGIAEIATSGDTNSIFSEPSADKLLINVALDWPKADTADDLTCTNCINATEIDGGALESELEAVVDLQDLQGAVTDAQVPNTITVDLASVASDLTCTDCIGTTEIADSYVLNTGDSITGELIVGNGATTGGLISWLEDTDNGSNYWRLVGPSSISSNVTCTIGSGGTIPDTCVGDGSDADTATPSVGSAGAIQVSDGAGAFLGSLVDNLFYDAGANALFLLDETTTYYKGGDYTTGGRFNADTVTSGNIRTYDFPDADGMLALLDLTQTFTNKTIDSDSNTLSVDPDEFKSADSPADEECYTYESTGTTGEWQTCGGGSGLTIGTTTITSGTDTKVLYNNAGVVGEYTVSGTGNVAMTTSPVFTTPNIGLANTNDGLKFGTNTGPVFYSDSGFTTPLGSLNFSSDGVFNLDSGTGGHNARFSFTGVTGTQTYTLPDATGTVALTSDITGTNSGTNTGDQTITLTGDVTGSGTGSFATTIGADKILESMLKAVDTPADEEFLTYESTTGDFEWQTGGSGAPTTADFLVGTSDAGLSAEIVVGTSPGGELGGTWASPTLDDSVTTTGWVMGTFSGTTLTAGTVNIDLLDAVGAVDMDYGSADVTDHTFTTDGTGTAEIVFPAGAIDGTEILNDTVALTTDTSGNYVSSATASGGLTLTGTEGGSLGILLPTATDALSANTSSGSGLELLSGGLALLQGCSDGQILAWTEATDLWGCSSAGGGSGDITSIGDVTSGAGFDGTQGTILTFNDAGGDKTLEYDNTNNWFEFNATLNPATNDGASLGNTTQQWSDIFLAEGGVVNWDNGDATLTQVGNVVTLAGADLKITTPGTASTSVATIDGTQTITNKTISSASNVLDACIPVAVTDEYSDLTTGTAKVSFRMPFAMTVTSVRASLVTVATGGTLVTVDINEAGTTILSTKLTFDASELTTTSATTAPVVSDTALADDALMTVDIDAVGSTTPGNGLKISICGTI